MGKLTGGLEEINSVVFDVEPLWRRTLAAMLERRLKGSVVVCSSLEELGAALTANPPPSLLVADPGENPEFKDVLEAALREIPGLTTIIVSTSRNNGHSSQAAALGAAAFIAKEHEVAVIEHSVRETLDAEIGQAVLTPREVEVLELVAQGMSNRQVAETLWLSDQTVKFHLANIYRRLGVSSRLAAVAEARQRGFLRIGTFADVTPGCDEILAAEDAAP